MRSAQDIRGDFLLDPDVVYLNHGSFGATPRAVLDRRRGSASIRVSAEYDDAVNAVATSLPLTPGDEVIVTDLEYGAMVLLWEEVARRTGAKVVTASVSLPVHDALQSPQMIAFPVPFDDGEHTLVRLSVQGYTTEEDCERLVRALAEI